MFGVLESPGNGVICENRAAVCCVPEHWLVSSQIILVDIIIVQ